MSRKKLPEGAARVGFWCRIEQKTLEFIKSYKAENTGRALDEIIAKEIEKKESRQRSREQRRATA